MDTKEMIFEDETRAKISQGVSKLARAVKTTLGPKGRCVVMQQAHGAPRISKDGVTVAEHVTPLKEKFENLGAELVKQSASKTVDCAGDGTTTATVLTEAIYNGGLKLISTGHHPMSLKRGIDKASERVVESLREKSIEVSSTDQIRQVATISANGDESVGSMIAEAMEKVGKAGIVTLEEGKSFESSLRVTKGYEFDRGYASHYFINDQDNGKVSYEDCYVWCLNEKLSGFDAIKKMEGLLTQVMNSGKPLIIVAETIENEVLATLVANYIRGFRVCCIKAPGFGDRRREMLQDIASLTGGNLLDKDQGKDPLKEATLDDLGICHRIDVTSERTIIVGKDEMGEKVEERVKQIRTQIADTDSDWDRERLQQRLAKLVGGVGVIEVGAATETEMKERKDRFEDALSATRAAIEEGVVPGGGLALVRAYQALEGFSTGDVDEDAGVKVLRDALRAPLMQISDNAGQSAEVILNEVLNQEDDAVGYNAADGTYVNMMEAGIVDPTKVTRSALQNAASIAGLLLTTDCAIGIEEGDKSPAHPGAGMMM